MNNLIYDPEKDFKNLCEEYNVTTQQLETLKILSEKLEILISTFIKCDNVLTYIKECEESNFSLHLQYLFDNWPTKQSSLSKSKIKLFAFDYLKLITKTKKTTSLKFDKINSYIKEWKLEQLKLEQEIFNTQNIVNICRNACDRFIIPNGNWNIVQSEKINLDNIKSPIQQDRMSLTLDYFKPLKWYAWPSELETLSKQKFKPKDQGIGAGEYWLSYIFGGEVQGANGTFDIALFNKDLLQRWEVKEYDEKTLTIRLGSHGTNATEKMSLDICDILMQLKDFSETFDKLFLDKPLKGSEFIWITNYVKSLKEYLELNFSKIVIRGEISNNDLQNLVAPIAGAQKVYELILSFQEPIIDLEINYHSIDLKQDDYYRKLSKVLTIFADSLKEEELLYALLGTLQHPVLTGKQLYKDFLINWSSYMTPENAFSNVDGVFLVHKNGFCIVPKQDFNNTFEYCRMSQGRRPNFKIQNIDSPNIIQDIKFFGIAYSNAMLGNVYTLMSGSINLQTFSTDEELFHKTIPWDNISINDSIWNENKITKIMKLAI